jgi:phosphatidylglycerol:prolipoprotein diacylglycerol transferase
LESLLCLAIGLVALILILQFRPALPGAVFVGALAGYTFGRQLPFPLRAEPRKSAIGRSLTMAAAGLVLIADIVLSIVA